MPRLTASTLHRVCSLNNLCRTIARDNFANVMRPKVAALAATTASETKLMLGIVRPMNDMAVQVGGAKAGRRLSTKITMNSATVIFVMSVNSVMGEHHLLEHLSFAAQSYCRLFAKQSSQKQKPSGLLANSGTSTAALNLHRSRPACHESMQRRTR